MSAVATGRFSRVVVVVLDSVGIGALPDAHKYGDAGAATLQHTAKAVGGLGIPNLARLGLGYIADIPGVARVPEPTGCFGKMAERSAGKDTTSGHWEMMGIVLSEPFRLFPNGFPPEIVEPFVRTTGRDVLGNRPASGIRIIEELGEEHINTGQWILYTSADSVFQLAAHEEKIPLKELYGACKQARDLLDPWQVGRVIARPFVGLPGAFIRTHNRHDFSMQPESPSVLLALKEAGLDVVGVGKIEDIFAGVGLTRSIRTPSNQEGVQQVLSLLKGSVEGLVFLNLVDFDMRFGHRRDPAGYAQALASFDEMLEPLLANLTDKDLLLITADHGCDPTWQVHTDHTREYVPVLMWSLGLKAGRDLGTRPTFADLGATVADALGVVWTGAGQSFLATG